MKRLLVLGLALVGGAVAVFGIVAARFQSTIQPNTFVGPENIGGLSREQAQAKLTLWWQDECRHPIALYVRSKAMGLSLSPSKCGVALDVQKTLLSAPMTTVLTSAEAPLAKEGGASKLPLKLAWLGQPNPEIQHYIDHIYPVGTPARVYLRRGEFQRKAASGGYSVDAKAFLTNLSTSIEQKAHEAEIPVIPATSRVNSQDLNQITDVVSTFTTKFPVRKKDRNVNIRIASSKIDGWVLMPGDTFSFNQVVGKRTIQDGYKEAPVFKNGKHDMGVGGGICQVSSTLYNAALFSNLQVVQRHNHSMPVAYLPVGRDATVDYGSLDLVLKNNLTSPIALSADYEPGKLTFRILGKKDPGLDVRVESADSQTWEAPVKTVSDPKLPLGQKKIIEKGQRGHSVRMIRVVSKDGREVAREPLGRSFYKGSQRVIAVGTQPPVAVPGFALNPGTSIAPAKP